MADIVPAICDACRRPFGYPLPLEEHAKIEPVCPRCGDRGQVLQGAYRFYGGGTYEFQPVHEVLGRPSTDDELNKLEAIFREAARHPQIDRQAICDALAKSNVQELRSLADVVPQNRNELYNFVMMLCAMITAMILAAEKLAKRRARNRAKAARRRRAND